MPLNGQGFILTSNRDEQRARKTALPPRKYVSGGQSLFYPKDREAGGTWIATGTGPYTACLLNGAHAPHAFSPPYRKSRGLVLLDFFEYNDPQRFGGEYDFSGIQPFTLLLVNNETPGLHELVWDGERPFYRDMDAARPFLWASVTLYDENRLQQRRHWFDDWLKERPAGLDSIFDFHEHGTGDPGNDLRIDRDDGVQTVSITSIQKTADGTRLKYRDLVEGRTYKIRIL